jgi:hypothetical protein
MRAFALAVFVVAVLAAGLALAGALAAGLAVFFAGAAFTGPPFAPRTVASARAAARPMIRNLWRRFILSVIPCPRLPLQDFFSPEFCRMPRKPSIPQPFKLTGKNADAACRRAWALSSAHPTRYQWIKAAWRPQIEDRS